MFRNFELYIGNTKTKQQTERLACAVKLQRLTSKRFDIRHSIVHVQSIFCIQTSIVSVFQHRI